MIEFKVEPRWLVFSFIMVVIVGTFMGFWFGLMLHKGAYEDIRESCWISDVQKEVGMPAPTEAEDWCEGQGHCGPARASLADMLAECEERKNPQWRLTLKNSTPPSKRWLPQSIRSLLE